jgi:hypothetical protein
MVVEVEDGLREFFGLGGVAEDLCAAMLAAG